MPTANEQHALPAVPDDGREYKSFGAPVLDIPEDEPGTISAIVAVFNNVDSGGDRIRPGFFAKSIARKKPPGVWGHDWLNTVAKTLEARELHPGDPMLPPGLMELGGLYIKGQFNLKTQRGSEAYEDVKFGIVDEFSFGFIARESETDKKTGVRDLIEGDILEWSPVLVGMNNRTRLLSVKSAEADSTSRALHESSDPGPSETKRSWKAYSREVETAVGEFTGHAIRRVRNRLDQKAGRVLSQSNFDSIASVADAMESGAGQLRDVLAAAQVRRNEPATDAAKADASPGEAKPAGVADPAAIGPATPAVAIPAPVDPAIPPASPPAAGPDDADILAQYAMTQYALTMAAVRSLSTHG